MVVSASALLDLAVAPDSGAFMATVPPHLCVGRSDRPFLFGGVAFAACIEAMERAAQSPAIFASAQFIAAARAGDDLRIEPEIVADGRSVRQCRVTALCGDRPFLQVYGACGGQDAAAVAQGPRMPIVAPPGACPERSVARLLSSNIQSLFEFRLAGGELPDRAGWTGEGDADGGGELLCWVRPRGGAAIDRRTMAVIADCAALALPGALGRQASGSSLDNMIRFVADPAEDWVLAAMRVDGVRGGLAHIATRLFSPDGTLLATAGQSMLLRLWDDG